MKKVKTVYDHIRSNNIKTIILVALFPIIFIALVFLFAWIVVPAADAVRVAAGVALPTMIGCLIWMGISWAFGDSMMLSVAGAKEIHDTDPANPDVTITNVCHFMRNYPFEFKPVKALYYPARQRHRCIPRTAPGSKGVHTVVFDYINARRGQSGRQCNIFNTAKNLTISGVCVMYFFGACNT